MGGERFFEGAAEECFEDALEGARTPTTSLPDTLDELAGREERAAATLPAFSGAA